MIEQVRSFTVGILKTGEYCNSIVSFAEEVDVSVLLISLPVLDSLVMLNGYKWNMLMACSYSCPSSALVKDYKRSCREGSSEAAQCWTKGRTHVWHRAATPLGCCSTVTIVVVPMRSGRNRWPCSAEAFNVLGKHNKRQQVERALITSVVKPCCILCFVVKPPTSMWKCKLQNSL